MRRCTPLAAVAAMALISAAPASAKHTSEESFSVGDATLLGPVHIRGEVADVHVHYSCTFGDHIWVSVKQSANGEIDPSISGEGSGFGGAAAVWWQSHRNSFTCDGKQHVGWFKVDTEEPASRGQLQNGWGWVQFCVTEEEGEERLDAIRMEWSRVVTN
jgi:hypothetical protein